MPHHCRPPSDFAVDVTENWQSEYLQFFLYIFGTVWLLQRGSPESKVMHRAGSNPTRNSAPGRTHAPAPRAGPRRAAGAGSCSPVRSG